jgi:hypothetical protein
MNPNAAAFSMILKQREMQGISNAGHGPHTWRPPQPPQNPRVPSYAPFPPVPQPYYNATAFNQPFPSATMFTPQLPGHNLYGGIATPAAPQFIAPQFPSFYANVQQSVQQNTAYGGAALQPSSYQYVPNQRYATTNYSHSKLKQTVSVEEAGQYYCEPCDKEFTLLSAFDTHKATHELCRHPGCQFSATRKVVMAHFHGSHGQFSGTGYKMIEVEGQKFRVLMGQSPEEISQWRAERRKKFPTAATEEAKKQRQDELTAAGGVAPSKSSGKFGNKREKEDRKRANVEGGRADEDEQEAKRAKGCESVNEAEGGDADGMPAATAADGERRATGKRRCIHWGRGRCKAGDACTFSHDFEPKQCEFFLRGRCKNGIKCFNIHNTAKRAEYRKENPTNSEGAASQGSSGATAADHSTKTKPERPLNKNGELAIPPPLAGGTRGTLWRKLLEDEISKEENVILQCLRYLVQNNFLDETAPASQ